MKRFLPIRTLILLVVLSSFLASLLLTSFVARTVWAQRPGGPTPAKKKKTDEKPPPPRPTDPKLIELHKDFLGKAEKLAEDYEKKRQFEKAREVYEAILRLVPRYPRAEDALQRVTEAEASVDHKKIVVAANKAWQDTGIVLQAGKPVIIQAEGSWTFKMTHTVSPDGVEIPKELRDFNLGALVAVIVTSNDPKEFKPFLVGAHKEFTAEQTGRLMLRMYDSDPSDNNGQVSVMVQSTFAKKQP
jgi:hypothetical protein